VLTKRVERAVATGTGGFFLMVAGVATLVAAVIAFLLARRVTRPIGEMQQTARRIAAGDLSARTDLGTQRNDEMTDLGRALNAMAAQLEHARGLERGFILSISHDLRTPLTSIRGYAEALADGTLDDADGRKRAAEIIGGEARRLERLVADLLDLARLDAHQFSLTPRPVDAGEVVEAAALAFAPAADDLGIRLHVDASKPVAADADPERLGQVVANLVENALKYATSGIEVAVARADGDVVIRVHDDGPGLSEADLPHVFDRLYASRTVPGRKVGTGLGLAIVRELAAAMGGSVWAEPSDRGARFVVRLPLPASAVATPISSPS
jgi:two-component system sensor histidine kinase BaeS